jgi:hypothetical protein
MPETFTPIKAAWETYFDDARARLAGHGGVLPRRKHVSRALVAEKWDPQWRGPLEQRGEPSVQGGIGVYPPCGA